MYLYHYITIYAEVKSIFLMFQENKLDDNGIQEIPCLKLTRFYFQTKLQISLSPASTHLLRLNKAYNHLLPQIFQIILAGSLLKTPLLLEDAAVLEVQIKIYLIKLNEVPKYNPSKVFIFRTEIDLGIIAYQPMEYDYESRQFQF